MKTIKVLSVRQPWAWLICAGYKNIENRTWKTDYRGKLFIHAGKEFEWHELNGLPHDYRKLVIEHFGIQFMRYGKKWTDVITKHKEEFGAIVGYADLTDCVRNANSIWAMPGCWHWELHRPLELAPIPLKGRLGIFEIPEPEALR